MPSLASATVFQPSKVYPVRVNVFGLNVAEDDPDWSGIDPSPPLATKFTLEGPDPKAGDTAEVEPSERKTLRTSATDNTIEPARPRARPTLNTAKF